MKDNHQMRNYARENRILYNNKTFAAIFVTYMKKKPMQQMLILLSFDENKVKHCAPPPSPSPSLPVCNTFTFSGKQGQIKNMGRLKSIAVRSYLISTLCEMYGFVHCTRT